jgi:CubicO group peptidase (beta-lactamase class C family)
MILSRREAMVGGLGSVLIPSALAAQNASLPVAGAADPFAALEAVVSDEMRASGTPGAALAIVAGDRIFVRGFGLASIEAGGAVDGDTLFRIASTTKMLTGAAVAVAAVRGLVDLHAPVGRYVPGLPAGIGGATLDQLLSHRAGLRDETVYHGLHDDAELGRFVASWRSDIQIAPPDDVYSYSNLGYGLAGHALDRRTGRAFADAVRAAVFEPLGMARSTFRPTEAMTFPISQGHEPSPAGPVVVRPFADNVRYWANGGAFTSAREFARFAVALLNDGMVDGRQALPPAAVALMLGAHAEVPGPPAGLPSHYGYGLNVRSIGGRRVLQHGGERIGFGSLFRIIPERRVGVVLLANRTGASLVGSLEAATEVALAMQARGGPPPTPGPAQAEGGRGQIAEAPLLESLLGRYVNAPGELELELLMRGGRVMMRGNGESGPVPVDRLPDGRYSAGGQAFSFIRGRRTGRIYLFVAGRALRRVSPHASPARRATRPRSAAGRRPPLR